MTSHQATKTIPVLLPELGEGIESALIAGWLVAEGAAVGAEDEIVDLVTDKATFSVPAGCAGIVEKILVTQGATVLVGAPLAVIRQV